METYTIQVRLPRSVKDELAALLETGHYENESAIVVEALHSLMQVQQSESQLAPLDPIDGFILRAITHYYMQPPHINSEASLIESQLTQLTTQGIYNAVLAHYLAGAFSLARAAELLGLWTFDLRARFARLEVPLRIAPANAVEAQADVTALQQWLSNA